MCLVRKHVPISMLPTPLSNAGTKTATSRLRSSPAAIDATGSRTTHQPSTQGITRRKTPLQITAKSSIVESPRQSKSLTLNAKSNFFLSNIPNTALLQTLDPALIGNDPDCYPFWDPQCQEEYQRWWLPPRTDSVVLPLTLSPGSSKVMGHRSWFSIKQTSRPSMKLEKMSLPSCKYSLVDGMAAEDTGKAKAKKKSLPRTVRKIRVYPTPHQKQLLAGMEGTSRYLYNHVTSMIRDKVIPFESSEAKEAKALARKQAHEAKDKKGEYKETEHPWLNFQYMRNFLVSNTSSFVKERPWMKDTVNAVRQVAVKEAIANHRAALTNLNAGNITRFTSPFRRKSRSWSIGLDPTQLKYDKVLPASSFGRLWVAERKFLQQTYTSQPRITRDKYKRYHLILVDEPEEAEEPLPDMEKTCNGH